MLAYFEMFAQDRQRFYRTAQARQCDATGFGGLGGTLIYRPETGGAELGFDAISANSMDAVSDRDFVIEFSANASMTMIISRA
jgi:argininosuccinate lyase